MESKKQLVIVPPMSEALQKLNEVLDGIAVDENIDISMIDDANEFTQFIASGGQSLVLFSNAKKCATFLQENRFLLTKNHSKVLLLTPKEIPAKILAKFTKIGLTESILESSPPKTLLYKVKLLLRSIKSQEKPQEQDQVVKSMLDTNQPFSTQALSIDHVSNMDDSVANSEENEKSKTKNNGDEIVLDYSKENEKAKKAYKEDSIETLWKTKKKHESIIEFDDQGKSEGHEEENILDTDPYYLSKKKKQQNGLEFIDAQLAEKSNAEVVHEENNFKSKKVDQSVIELEANTPKKGHATFTEESDYYSLKENEDHFKLEESDSTSADKKSQSVEALAEKKKRDLEELEELFEMARKRQAANIVEGQDEYYKGHKLADNSVELLDGEEESSEKKEYDNSEINSHKKSIEIEVSEARKENTERGPYFKDNEEMDPSKNKSPEANENALEKDASPERIETFIKSEVTNHSERKLQFEEEIAKEKNNSNDFDLNFDAENRQKKSAGITEETLVMPKAKDQNVNENENNKELAKTSGLFESVDGALGAKSTTDNHLEETAAARSHSKEVNIKLLDGDNETQRNKTSEENNSSIALLKVDQTDLILEAAKEKKASGQTDKIDTYYRSNDRKSTEFSWDNLTSKERDINLALTKRSQKPDENINTSVFKDAGEISIDYRMLKEEFDSISRSVNLLQSESTLRKTGKASDDLEEDSFKVIEIDDRGFDFSIKIINLMYLKETKPIDIYKQIAEELVSRYNGYSVFYSYKPSDKKHNEVFDSFMLLPQPLVKEELKDWWINNKKEESLFSDYFSKTMSTWICREIPSLHGSGGYWEDVELPSWAQNELTNKKVELVFPYFDGVDRMGLALVFFPEGLNPKQEKAIDVTLEMARTLLLDNIQRKSSSTNGVENKMDESNDKDDKKGIKNLFSGIFNRNKAS